MYLVIAFLTAIVLIVAIVCYYYYHKDKLAREYDYLNPYVDEIIETGSWKSVVTGRTNATYKVFKRTYKNGKVEFFERKYS